MREWLGILFALLQSACWAGTSIILRVLSKRLDAYVVNGLRSIVGWVVVVLITVLTGGFSDWHLLTWTQPFLPDRAGNPGWRVWRCTLCL